MYLGIDVGTSGVKTTLIDDAQRIVGAATAPLDVSRPELGWSEQNPHDWIAAAGQTLDALRAAHAGALASVRGIGLSGQMHGATLLDERDEPLRPCLLWNDTRAHREAAKLDADPRFRAVTGNIVFPGFTAPKVAWVREHEPRVFERTRRVLLPKDFLRLWLTGEHASDMSDASGTSWLDTGARRWSTELLADTGLDERQMPSLVEGTAASGTLRAELAARWRMGRTVVVAGGAGDNAASACGLGAIRDGAAFVSLGTSGVLFAVNRVYSPNAASAVHTFCHAVPGTWHQMGVILSATDSVNWLAALTSTTPAELTASLGERLGPPGRVTFLPYLGGERTPHNDATIRGAFAGMSHETDRRALAQAVVEGVAFALCDCRDALRAAGTTIARLSAVGGGTRSRYWLELLATTLNAPVDVPAAGDFGAAFGAARLAMTAVTRAEAAQVCTPPPVSETIEPHASQVAAYAAAHERYRALYPALRDGS
ncbi:MAG TPA: xylulokinase [Gammaproteobacteria bacterium]|nr:xylulokinase [Gammaproteobacteria bacterium]